MLKLYKPKMVFFMEIKVDKKRMECVCCKLGFVNGIDVGTNGSKGGVCLAWIEDLSNSLLYFSNNFVDVIIEGVNGNDGW